MSEESSPQKHTFSHDQHREYLSLLDRLRDTWLEVFEGNSDFYQAHYWDLLAMMWWHEEPVRKTDALTFMTSVKSPLTAAKYIDVAIAEGFIEEMVNPKDARSRLLSLSPPMRTRMDGVLDGALGQLLETARHIMGERA
jgi:hypothetical protein